MLEQFRTYNQQQNLFTDGSKILLAVSGGIDSVVMAHLFHEAKIKFGIIHCNFKLRGKESDADKKFVKKTAAAFQAPCYSRDFDTKGFAAENNISVQMAARKLRYEYFEEIRIKNKYDFIAVAHNADDSSETVLLNLIRGTGIAGYHGISSRNKKIIRPLLFASRAEILKYAKKKKITWREDSSNQSDNYLRNKLRLKIIPKLKKINPSIDVSFQNHIAQMSEVESLYQEYILKLKEELLEKKGSELHINIQQLNKHAAPATLLFELLKDYGFNSETVKDIKENLASQSGKRFLSETHRLIKDREQLILTGKNPKDEEEIEITADLHVVQWKHHQLYIRKITLTSDLKEKILSGDSKDKNIAYLDESKIIFPLSVRKWNQGDYFFPLGMKGKKRLSDYFIDKKIPVSEKEKTWLLTSSNNIAWIIGGQIDDRYKITEESGNCLQLIFEKA
ncbi:MAG: tRNA lysidine(34) synthetase TilS [Bacteroidota bacterium]